jgi:transposase
MEKIEQQASREAKRVKKEFIVENAVKGTLTNQQAADILCLSRRQVIRLKKRYRQSGPEGIRDRRAYAIRRKRKSIETVRTICRLKQTLYHRFLGATFL